MDPYVAGPANDSRTDTQEVMSDGSVTLVSEVTRPTRKSDAGSVVN